MTPEVWARENLAGYLAGGLTTQERFDMEELLRTDPALAADLDSMRGVDDRLRKLFVAAKPPLALEDAVIQSLRRRHTDAVRGGGRKWPVGWIIGGVAVGLVALIGIGTFATMEPLGGPRMAASGQLEPAQRRTIEPSVQTDYMATQIIVDDSKSMEAMGKNSTGGRSLAGFDGALQSTPERRMEPGTGSMATHPKGFDYTGTNATAGFDLPKAPSATRSYFGVLKVKESVNDKKWGTAVTSDDNARSLDAFAGLTPAGTLTPDLGVPINNSSMNFTKVWDATKQRGGGGGLGGALGGQGGEGKGSGERLADGKVPGVANLSDVEGWLGAEKAGGGKPDPGYYSRITPKSEAKKESMPPPPTTPAPSRPTIVPMQDAPVGSTTPPPYLGAAPLPSQPSVPTFESPARGLIGTPGLPPSPPIAQSPAASSFKPGEFFGNESLGGPKNINRKMAGQDADVKASKELQEAAKQLESLDGQGKDGSPKDGQPKDEEPRKDSAKEARLELESAELAQAKDKDIKKEPAPADPKVEAKPEPKAPPAQRRIVIRSGDIEFEVDSFDDAASIITKLIAKTKGGVVATTNSDKLPNGKTRGSIVVRMPPDELDDFVMAMRRDLAKIGELKEQRIGSQDVTKQYTDLESELRGLRVSEERLIVMLKDVKATLKDLLAVETQLANTRTKIERIEGELRYYSNLAAMSTLTIKLYEKEIRVAAGVLDIETVKAGIEADDVDKAFREARAAIDELKGRIFRSELKQGMAGQVNAILEFDIAPDSSGLMRDKLKQLGAMPRLEVDRIQKVEGGGSAARDSKVKRGDTQFFVSIYNLANVEPRESVNLTVVGNDVPASYRKLRDLVVKLNGNLRHTALQNTDARNVSANLIFDVRRSDEAIVQTALDEAGDFMGRRIERAAENANVTDTKVRFVVHLVSVGGITAREKNVVALAALDVPASYRKVRDAVAKAKGYVRDAKLIETDRVNVSAFLDFDVLRADEAGLLAILNEAGETLSRNVERWPEGNTVTDAKIGFKVTMNSVAAIPSRETVTLKIAAVDVPATFNKLRDLANDKKAQISVANLRETDKPGMDGSLVFDVLRASEAEIRAALDAAGETLSRQVARQATGANVTDAKVAFNVNVVAVAAVPARETVNLTIAAVDVPAAFAKLRESAAAAQAYVTVANLQENDRANMSGVFEFDVLRQNEKLMRNELDNAGEQLGRQVERKPSGTDVTDGKVSFKVTLKSANSIPPRQGYELHVKVDNAHEKMKVLQARVQEVNGRAVKGPIENKTATGKTVASATFFVPLASGAGLFEEFKKVGVVGKQDEQKYPHAPEGKLAQAVIVVELFEDDWIVAGDGGFGSQLRGGVSWSLRFLSWTVSFLIAVLVFVGPWVLLIWGVYRIFFRRSPAQAAK